MPTLTIQQILDLTHGRTSGDPGGTIERVAPLDEAGPDDLAFLVGDDPAPALTSKAGAILVSNALEGDSNLWIRVENPYFAFSQVLREWFWNVPAPEGISANASVDPSASLGDGVRIGPNVTVGANVIIGDRTVIREGCSIGNGVTIGRNGILYPNVVIYQDVRIGDRCILHSGVVIGSDGFGFATHDGVHHKIPQIGSVEIGNDVEIGANSTVDRGTLRDTIIREGTKIDNFVMIAHNVVVGRHCFMAAQSGIAGSTSIGDYCAFGGQSGVVGHVTLGDQVMVAAKSAVTKSFDGPVTLAGSPARPLRETRRNEASIRRIPDMMKRLAELEQRIDRVNSQEKED